MDNEGYELYLLPSGGRAYIWVDVEKGRPLLDVVSFGGIRGRDVSQILDSTGSAAAVVFPEGQDRRFFLAGTGNFPRLRANFSLAFNKDWKKQKSSTGSSYWFSQKDGIAVALGSKMALVSNVDPYEDFQVETPPQGFMEFRQGLVMAGWMPSPSEPINKFLETLGIPLQIPAEGFFFGAARTAQPDNDEPWELVLSIKAASAAQARSLLALFSVARLFMRGMMAPVETAAFMMSPQEAAGLLFANNPEQNEEFLTLRIGPLGEDRIALLFNMFYVYSN
jgi:hypothetical protein